MAKTLKPNLDKDELNTLYRANLAYAKNTHEYFFKTKKDLDYKIFNPSIMHEQSFISFVGGQGAKRLLDMLYKLAFNAKSNKIALDRHYAKTFLPKTNALKPLAFSYGDTRRNAFRRANME